MPTKYEEKFAALKGLPSGLARQMSPTGPDKFRKVVSEARAAKRKKVEAALASASEKTGAFKPKSGDVRDESTARSSVDQSSGEVTKAEKVRAWREANPEAYAEQKRRAAEQKAKKRAEKEAK